MVSVVMKSKRNRSTNSNTKASNKRPCIDLNETDEGVVNDSDGSLVQPEESSTDVDTSTDSLPRSKSNVWNHAHRDPKDPGWAICDLCPAFPVPKRISIKGGATSTLRKHLIKAHKKDDLSLIPRDDKRCEKLTIAERDKLHQLLINAIIVDGRCFSDFRKPGFSRFLDYIMPGE